MTDCAFYLKSCDSLRWNHEKHKTPIVTIGKAIRRHNNGLEALKNKKAQAISCLGLLV